MSKFSVSIKKHKFKVLVGIIVVIILIIVIFVFALKNNKQGVGQDTIVAIKEVSIVTMADRGVLKQTVRYPGLVVSDQEVKIVSKGSGNISGLDFKVGDKIFSDQVLARIDSVDANPAKANYQNTVTALGNALISKQNIANTSEQSFKSAQIAYDTSKIATEQARLSLENRKNISSQSEDDIVTNADVTADSVAGISSSIVVGINNITGFNENNEVSVSYEKNLGALNSESLSNAKSSFLTANNKLKSYQGKTFSSVGDKVDAVKDLATSVQQLVNATQVLLQNTITSTDLPQSSASGSSLSGLQAAVSAYQNQINGALGQINGAKQALSNTQLSNSSTIDSLQKAYELAKQQENAAAQNLNNVLAAGKTQVDGAQSQVDLLAGQMNLSRIQVDNLTIKAPISGTITQKMISAGDTVSPGQVVAVMSQTAKLKIQTYVDQTYINSLQVGMPATITDNNGNIFKGIIISISPSADATTKRFLVEADFESESVPNLPNPGIIVSISFEITRVSDKPGAIFIPITAVNVGQNESYIFLYDNGRAKKKIVNVLGVDGENAQINVNASTTLPLDTKIIISGNRLVKEGDEVRIVTSTEINQSK